MTTTEALRLKIKKYVDTADESALLVVEQFLENEHDDDWWDKLPAEVQESIDLAIRQIEEGKEIPHEKIKQMYPQWFRP